jgi:DNA-binding MarR family transcriptional regulator
MNKWTYDDVTTELLAILPMLNRIVAWEVRREVGEDTTMPQYRVLTHLAETPMTLSTLAKKRFVSLQSMGELVQTLVERGWVVRTPDPNDRRQHWLQTSEAGRLHLERAQEQMIRRLAPTMERLGADEMAAIQIALPALHRVLLEMKESESDGGN